MITTKVLKERVFDPARSKWETRFEGHRTFMGQYCVHTLRSGPVFDTEGDAMVWAQSARTQGEPANSSQELKPVRTVKPRAKKATKKSKRTRRKGK